MPFDQLTRNRLNHFVGEARDLLTAEFTRQLQHEYGMDPATGDVAPQETLTALDDARRETARILRTTLEHYLASAPRQDVSAQRATIERIVREQAFTVLNRLCAVRMAEARGFVIEAVGQGYRSRSFQPYAQLAGPALGETGNVYRAFLFSLFDEFAVELPVLFDRFSPMGRLFPRPAALLELLELINHPDLASLWAEDETLGWIYQYFNSQEERRQMRAESQAPRNRRELAVRNQFFTPRYVVEFLTDNTLGRIWYEMTEGSTQLAEGCRYMVRRPGEVFVGDTGYLATYWGYSAVELVCQQQWRTLPDALSWNLLRGVALAIDGENPAVVRGLAPVDLRSPAEIRDELLAAKTAEYAATGAWQGSSLELWLCLFETARRHHAAHSESTAHALDTLDELYRAWRAALEAEHNEIEQTKLLRQPVYIPFRRLKDPRTILMLDPACGSMHFGLYSFDLFEVIYGEAWDYEEKSGDDALLRPDHLRSLHESYPDRATFLRDVPRLIVEHNIHGIDIDPRAVQIAGLSLWLRAQKSWQQKKMMPADRPSISKSNIVCAEPMPGNKAQLEAFLKTLHEERLETLIRRVLAVPEHQRVRATPTMADALCDLVRVVWEEMKLAGEAGSLLKIEESLGTAIQQARDEWAQQPLFRVETFRLTEADAAPAKPQINYTRTVPGEGTDFWERAEALVLAALAQYAKQANGDSYARRLFAADAAHGFAFIDVCRKRYDVVLMNPPFGRIIDSNRKFLETAYPDTWTDYYNVFPTRGLDLLYVTGRLGAIVPNRLLETKKSAWLRQKLITESPLQLLVNIGQAVMDDAAVNALVLVASNDIRYTQSTIPVHDLSGKAIDDRANALLSWADTPSSLLLPARVELIPGYTINVAMSESITKVWERTHTLDPTFASVVTGGKTFDDARFLRCWWEVAAKGYGVRWFSVDTGGNYQLFLTPSSFVENWADDGAEARANSIARYGTDAQVKQSSKYWFRPGIAYPYTSSIGFGPRVFPERTILSSDVVGVFPHDGANTAILLGILASSWTSEVLATFGTSRKTENSSVKSLPIDLNASQVQDIAPHVQKAFDSMFFYESSVETSLFCRKLLEAVDIRSIREDIERLIREIDQIACYAYGLAPQTHRKQDISENVIKFISEPTPISSTSDKLSIMIGIVFGRWNITIAQCDSQISPSLNPFAPLPACPPSMLKNDAGLPATPADVPADYPLRISWPGILVDDPGHTEDIVGRVREALAVIWPATYDAIEQEACQILGVASLRDYFGNPNRFFDDHLKRYSKSRRQAPIYWPLSTASGSYTLWIYYHRLNDQMLYTCVVDFVDPKLKQVSEEAARLRQRSNRSRDDERELTRLSDLERELKELRGELLRLAPIWKPNLNDGVQITAAPLWKFFQHRAWQRTLRETWQTLEAGDYDWAHLAMSLWPARVVPKCTTDRSLAIAHDVEDRFWVEENGRWRPLAAPEQEIAGQRARQQARLSEAKRRLLLTTLRQLADDSARGVAARQVAQHLVEGTWDDTELALLCWPQRVAEKCLDDPVLANTLRLNLPAKRTKRAVDRWMAELAATGCPAEAAALLTTLDDDIAFDRLLAELEAGRRDRAPLALPLWPDRVIDRCLENVELAAVHDLRRFFWLEERDGWRRRREPAVEVAVEIERRK